ncbi:glycosyltransferase family 2 protein [Paludisphaera sp.]|uniref:glycosyltransferase family 2 protein n=1 Tax=Paludisphaera sp. TaxID=2017432 RepID=UPI00301CF33D
MISVVVPLYNEEENLHELYRRLKSSLSGTGLDYEIILVDDGARDGTPSRIDELADRDRRVVALHLSRNFGHQAAVSAGLDHARGGGVVVIDGDLQDPPELIPAMIDKWRQGHEVVYAVRRRREEAWPKRLGYFAFYRILSAISDMDIPLDSGDFCLMDRKVVDVLVHLPERMRFIRGLRSFVGFDQVGLEYDRPARGAGTPKYTLGRLIALAIDGLISFSGRPLRLATYLGLAAVGVATGLSIWIFHDALAHGKSPAGWASGAVIVLFMGSVQLLSLGIIGEYIRLIFLEVKRRPTYILRDRPSRAEADREADRP